jgi:hypothetical protein
MIARLKPEVVIIDSVMIDTDDMIIKLQHEPTSNPLMGIGRDSQALVGIPSRGALEAIASLHGYDVKYIDWSEREIKNHRDIEDYVTNGRFTVILEPA